MSSYLWLTAVRACERYISQGLAVAHVSRVSALSHLAPLWPHGETRENSSVTSQQLHKVESSSCQLRVHAAERPLIWPPAKNAKRSPRVCAASTLGALGSWRVGSPTAIANRRNTISPLMGGFRKKKSRLALQGQFLLVRGFCPHEPNVHLAEGGVRSVQTPG